MAILVLFSGACNSGKTTTLKAVAEKLNSFGYRVKIIDELIRKETNEPIDALRKNAKKYLQLQKKIITEKLKQEENAIHENSGVIYLADRAATDSAFYLENYIDKSQLNENDIREFCELDNKIHDHLQRFFWSYSLVIEFSPVDIVEEDKYRPKYLKLLQEYEANCISRLNSFYSNWSEDKSVMHASAKHPQLVEHIINRIMDVWHKKY